MAAIRFTIFIVSRLAVITRRKSLRKTSANHHLFTKQLHGLVNGLVVAYDLVDLRFDPPALLVEFRDDGLAAFDRV